MVRSVAQHLASYLIELCRESGISRFHATQVVPSNLPDQAQFDLVREATKYSPANLTMIGTTGWVEVRNANSQPLYAFKAKSFRHPSDEEAVQTIDAMVFTGDSLNDEAICQRMEYFMARWQRAVADARKFRMEND